MMRLAFRYGISLLIAGSIFGLVNYIDVLRPDPCCDWIVRRGFPFAILIRGGFQGMHEYLWGGIALDLIVGVAVAVVIAHILDRIFINRKSPQDDIWRS